jgi:hypothetical protein
MNPAIPMSDAEVGRWLKNFATSHARREHAGIVVRVEVDDGREGRPYGIRLVLGGRTQPPPDAPPLELEFAEVAAGRSRFDWCEALAQRIRSEARTLAAATRPARSA